MVFKHDFKSYFILYFFGCGYFTRDCWSTTSKKNIEMEYSRIFLLFYGLLLCFVSMGTNAVNSRVVSHMSFVFINPCYPRVTRGQTVFTVRIKSEHGNIRKPFFKSSLRARIESLSFVNESRSKEEREFW